MPFYFPRRIACWLGLVFLVSAPAIAQSAGSLILVHPQPESATDARFDYPVALLSAALAKAPGQVVLEAFPAQVTQARALKLLEDAQGLDVVWSVTTIDRETKLLPVRIPIYKGLIGLRLLLAHKTVAPSLEQVEAVEDLQTFTFVQGSDWPDTTILRNSGLKVVGGLDYLSLFQMLELGRGDVFPRSVLEVWDELDMLEQTARTSGTQLDGKSAVMLDERLALCYSGAVYFFVSRDRPALAQRLEQGLRSLIRSGEFEEIFRTFHGDVLDKARLEDRLIIQMENPLLPPSTPLQSKELWHPVLSSDTKH